MSVDKLKYKCSEKEAAVEIPSGDKISDNSIQNLFSYTASFRLNGAW